ncbi:hypothetical protein Noda2021_05720 [Candidatus Dependentiae bacterium Noda2021]|nr:hypothetical protein Noda2021_05720 [Candidatus Dependentiae bacterium Noda2021]
MKLLDGKLKENDSNKGNTMKNKIILYCVLISACAVAMEKNESNPTYVQILPYEIQTKELVQQIINTAESLEQALKSLQSYRSVNKSFRDYVTKNKESIEAALNKKFLLAALGSGNFRNADVKKQVLSALNEALKKETVNSIRLKDLIDLIDNNKSVSKQNLDYALALLKKSIKEKNFVFSASILGALNYFYINKRLLLEPTHKKHFEEIMEALADLQSSPAYTASAYEIYLLVKNMATKAFGKM